MAYIRDNSTLFAMGGAEGIDNLEVLWYCNQSRE